MKVQLDKLRYPIGPFEYGKSYSLDDTRKHIKVLARFPKELRNTLKKLKSGDLEKTYRPEGWTIRQVVNHIVDSHLNAYIRVKLAVTEPTPIIKPYEEQLWAELEDGKHGSVKISLKLLSALHKRWTNFLKSLQEDDLEKGYYHPASKRTVSVQEAIALYVWHSTHHLGHIQLVVEGKSQSVGGKKNAEEAKADTDNRPKSVAPAQAPTKRSITSEHREKIRAAQLARHAKNAASGATETPATITAPAAKRGRKPGVKAAAAPVAAVDIAKPKRGRKPGVKAAAAPMADVDTAKPKRGRKPGVKAAAAPVTAVDTAKPKRGRKPGVKAAAATLTAMEVQKPKRGRKPGIKAAVAQGDAPAKRTRRTKAEMAAARSGEAVASQTTPAETPKTRAPRGAKKSAEAVAKPVKAVKAAKPAKSAATSGEAPKRRGLSPEKMAEIRAMRGVKKTAENASPAPQTVKPAKAVKAAKPAKSAATSGEAPKRRGLSPEKMAEIRAMRGTKKAAENTAPTPETAKPAKVTKATKTATTPIGDAPKRRGLSPERMAEIRAMKKKKE